MQKDEPSFSSAVINAGELIWQLNGHLLSKSLSDIRILHNIKPHIFNLLAHKAQYCYFPLEILRL